MSESKWKQIVGKTIGESAYVSPDSLQADFSRAMNEICFPSADQRALEEEKKVAIRILKAAGIDYHVLLRSRKAKTTEEEVKILHNPIKTAVTENDYSVWLSGLRLRHR